MRILVTVFAIAFATALDVGATGGVYTLVPARDAAACARACTDDSLCVAWTFQTNGACELRATVPASQPQGAAFGLSSRAPSSLRVDAASASSPQPIAVTDISAPEPEAPAPAHTEDETSLQLLGGLDESQDAALRLSLN